MNLLESLRGGLIVSVQAAPGSPLDDPTVIAAMAAAAQAAGAVGLRIQGVANLQAVRERVQVPIIGLIKRGYPGIGPYITPSLLEVEEILATGAQIVAFDATPRSRPQSQTIAQLIARIREGGAIAMADCARTADGRAAQAAGAQILATTLCGYTEQTAEIVLPALELVAELAKLNAFCICEGGVYSPDLAGRAVAAGADAVVVGTAITGLEWVTAGFVSEISRIADNRRNI
ncbi:MAG: putative N-acetylmannosamine-6-phosphate 2-epimerase [Candidatus Eremiobacteraeota bacterium]|nr:putative N-acetylmannosamine-6-phosphate 2-epimerase [Candidatus Eremiobacteraeota bacterium]